MSNPFKPFHEMTDADYASVGLMCGLEVHQQLLTDRKLFCRCPAGRYSSAYDAEILRHMRPTLSELGEYDGTALMEKKTRKNIYYHIHHSTVCTYEFDDTPPFMISEQALDIALELGLLVNLKMVGELHIARKQYLDGSIPTGFQRTTIVGVDGWIPYKDRRIGIRQVGLEEDSCREVRDEGHDRVYLTDRLGTPLAEVVTEPDMRTPQECAEVCKLIGQICRSTGHVRTGYGATREDVNVSVRGGTRIEIKGVPQITRIPRLIYNEAMRQWSLLQIRQELHDRGIQSDSFEWSTHDVTPHVQRVVFPPIREAIDAGLRVQCVVLKGFAGLLNRPTQEHTTFATEFSDRVRVIACLTRLPNLVHSDSAAEWLPARDWKHLRRKTRADVNDALLLVWGNEMDVRTASEEIAIRAREATEGIPQDTRQALDDDTNGFERVLPGPERMYPDTDLPPIAVTIDRLERIREQLPEPVWERLKRYEGLKIPPDVRDPLSISQRAPLFDQVMALPGVDPTFAAVVLVQRMLDFKRRGLRPHRLDDGDIFEVFRAMSEGRITREAVVDVLKFWLTEEVQGDSPEARLTTACESLRLAPADHAEIIEAVGAAVLATQEREYPNDGARYRYAMGRAVATLRRGCDGRKLAAMVAETLGMTTGSAASTAGASK